MSLDKAIKFGKEWRNPKRSASKHCWNHGGCLRCESDRLIRTKREQLKANESKKDSECR